MKKDYLNELVAKSTALAEALQKPQQQAKATLFTRRMGPIIKAPEAKVFLIRMLDTSFRSLNRKRIANYIVKLLKTPSTSLALFTSTEKILISIFQSIGFRLPSISIPILLGQIKRVTSPALYFENSNQFKKHLQKRKNENIQLNVNPIGEALIGESAAEERIEAYCALLRQKDVDYISIKISTISSQIKPLAFDVTVEHLVTKLTVIYRELLVIEKETGVLKFVNLDMEAYRDLEITVAVFMTTLDLPEFKNLRAGIVLQAYLPDAYAIFQKLKNWAVQRISNGGAPIKIRLVKGANLEMEKTEASIEDWPLTTYHSKLDTDANYKKVLLEMLHADTAKAVNIGIASHNIFDLAFALQRVQEEKIQNFVDFEMLEGMADETVYELLKRKVSVLLYTPIVKEENYNNAIAYLVRRLDEGTQEGNFLREGFQLEVGSLQWNKLQEQFIKSVERLESVPITPNRNQDRTTQTFSTQDAFKNVANTDWILPANRSWVSMLKTRWNDPISILGNTIPVVGDLTKKERERIQLDSWNGTHPWNYELADLDDYRIFLSSDSPWTTYSNEERAKFLKLAAVEIEKNRGDLIGVAVSELGKTIAEVDVEVSEAVDFANYYAQNILDIALHENLEYKNEGVHLVLSPWNFPIAIPIGGVLASLAAGKRVILKPSQNAAACGYLISKALWEAGIPKNAFAFLPAHEHTLDPLLTKPKLFDAILLTGSTNTAKYLLDRTPYLPLFAETGGKNATIVTALSDREQAIENVVQSAFGNAGQKCSATSLLILEEEVFNDVHFRNLLKDCAESKTHGNPWNLETDIGPLAVPINENLRTVLDNTEESQWLLKPKLNGNFMMSPGIKWGIDTEDFAFQNELFGPILSVMKAKNLKEAIGLVNSTDYGLTSGIETLDPNEINVWADQIKAGNLYANRPTTGAIVERQPFGGMKASCFGFGMKAGGFNYVRQFLKRKEKKMVLNKVIENYTTAYNEHFSQTMDYANLRGQHNKNRYLKPKRIVVCFDAKVSIDHLTKIEAIGKIIDVPVHSFSTENIAKLTTYKKLSSWNEIYDLIDHDTIVRVLNPSRIDFNFLRHCHNRAVNVYSEKPSNHGSYEWLVYLSEQNISINYHRYGNLMGETWNEEATNDKEIE